MSIIPIAQAAQLLPAALAAGKVATEAVGSFAGLLRDALSSSTDPAPAASKSQDATNADWPKELSSLMRNFASAFQRLLSDHGLDSGSPVELQLDDQGDVKVLGAHPHGAAIENLLAKAQGLTELFRTIAAKATAHKKAEEFAAFQADSRSGAQDFPLLFSQERAPRFQMRLQGESAQATFASP